LFLISFLSHFYQKEREKKIRKREKEREKKERKRERETQTKNKKIHTEENVTKM